MSLKAEICGLSPIDPSTYPRVPRGGSYNDRIVKTQSRHNEVQRTEQMHLAEVLDFRPDQGIIRLHEQRVVILSAAAMGLMRKELIDTLGLETA
jgi:hypothetical protein